VQEVPGSNPGSPTKRFKRLHPSMLLLSIVWSPNTSHAARAYDGER
jgi:hypothetical protein